MKSGYNIDYSMYEKSNARISRWIDFLVCSWESMELLDNLWIDYDNSNFCYKTIGETYCQILQTKVKWFSGVCHMFHCDYNGVSVPLFLYNYYKGKSRLSFYGSFFRLIDTGYLVSDYLQVVLTWFTCPSDALISRIDYRLDFLLGEKVNIPTIPNILKHSFSLSNVREWKKGQTLTNWQVGDKKSKSVVFRLYDKLLDSSKKWKDFLYLDYYRFESVHRIEFECNLKFCFWYTIKQLDSLLDKVYKVFWISENKRLWQILHRYDSHKLVYNRKEIDMYMSYISRWINFLCSNYMLSNEQQQMFDKSLNPMSICFDYIKDYIGDRHRLFDYIYIENLEHIKQKYNAYKKEKIENKNIETL